jgi:hypothetical protein
MLASGIRRVEIAYLLGLSVETVGYHARKLASGGPEDVPNSGRLIRQGASGQAVGSLVRRWRWRRG